MNIDDYVLDTLMRDLAGHDRSSSSFLIFLHLWFRSGGRPGARVLASYQEMAGSVGISKSAAQKAIRRLLGRRLIRMRKTSATAIPEYQVLTPWRKTAKAPEHSGR